MSDYVNNVRLSFLDATDPIHEHWLALNYLVIILFLKHVQIHTKKCPKFKKLTKLSDLFGF